VEEFGRHPSGSAVLICSGWASGESTVTEATAAALLACKLGVAHQYVLLEQEARNTLQNAERVRPMVESRRITRVSVVSGDFHMRRVEHIFNAVFSNSSVQFRFIPAPSNLSEVQYAKRLAWEVRSVAPGTSIWTSSYLFHF
jgi:uncharacterized SAM-binding protein YcdF (DUF218 family)